MSAYIDDDLGPEMVQCMEQHALHCMACSDILKGMWQVRLTLQGLCEQSPPASFKLRLSNCLQEASFPPGRPRAHLPA